MCTLLWCERLCLAVLFCHHRCCDLVPSWVEPKSGFHQPQQSFQLVCSHCQKFQKPWVEAIIYGIELIGNYVRLLIWIFYNNWWWSVIPVCYTSISLFIDIFPISQSKLESLLNIILNRNTAPYNIDTVVHII